MVREYPIDDETIGVDTVLEAGPGGIYIDRPHTADHFRAEHWRPKIWSREPLRSWLADDKRIDSDRAREMVMQFQQTQEPLPCALREEDERRILALIARTQE
ncbi:MAG: trimethylamine methyltransferase family protein [Acidobacteriota bacterium]